MLSAIEKRKLQKIIVEQNNLLGSALTAIEKRKVQKAKIEAMNALGMLKANTEAAETALSGENSELQLIKDEIDINPDESAIAPDGSSNFGEIKPEIASIIGRQAGKIKLQIGKDDGFERFGIVHIESGHKQEISSVGMTVEEFVYRITSNPDEVRKADGGSLFLVKSLKDKKDITSVAVVKLKPSDEGDFYRVETAFISNISRFEKKYTLLWQKSETSTPDSGNQDSFAAQPSSEAGDGGPNGALEQNSLNNSLSDFEEKSKNANDSLIKSPGGSYNFGEITSEIAAEISRPSGVIRLEVGEYDSENAIGNGYALIEGLRKQELKSTGMLTVEKFVKFVAENFIEIRAVPGSKDLLLTAISDNGRVMLLTIKKTGESPYYVVEDAEAPRAGLGRRSKWILLWQKPESKIDETPIEEGDNESTQQADIGDDLDPNSPNYRYKDTGNIAGSRKEIASQIIRNASKSGQRLRANDIDWSEIEQNSREARELITKSNLFGSVDWENLKANEMDASAGYLIDRVYAAIGKEPSEDSPQARKDYVVGLESLRDRLESCKTADQVTKVIDELREEMEGVTLNSEETDSYNDFKAKYDIVYDKVRTFKAEKNRLWKEYYSLDMKYNSLSYEQGKRVNRKWKRDPELDKQMAEITPLKEAADKAYQDFKSANPDFNEERVELGSGSFTFANKYDLERMELRNQMEEVVNAARIRNRLENPLHRAWLLMGDRFVKTLYYRSRMGSDSFRNHVAIAKAGKIKDWSWAEKETTERKKSTKENQRFQLQVADTFERVGGRQITVDSTTELKEHFGLREVQSGNWVLRDVNSAKFHTEQTAMAFADLADILGVPDKTVSMHGRLAMAFGARGHGNAGFGGAARAHYESIQRVINITKLGGGGCLGHEWFHSLDNLLTEALTGNPSGANDFITEGAALPDGVLKGAFSELNRVMMQGNIRLPVVFAYTDKDLRTAKYNIDRSFGNPNVINAKIKNAGSVTEAVLAVVNVYGEESLYDKKSRGYGWAKIAVAYYDNNAAGNKVQVEAGRATSSYERESTRLDGGINGKYWSQPKEMAARAFQSYLEDKLAGQQRRNDYLSSLADNKYYQDGLFGPVFPYPEGDERKRINEAFDKLISAMHESDAFAALDSVFAKMAEIEL